MGKLRAGVGVLLFVSAMATSNTQVFVPAGVTMGTAAGATSRTFRSPNKVFQVTVEVMGMAVPTTQSPMLATSATMSRVQEGRTNTLWVRPIAGWSVLGLNESDVFVSDAGEFFVTTRGSQDEVELHRQDKTLKLHQRTYGTASLFLSPSQRITKVDKVDGKEVVCLWDRERNTWELFSTTDGKRLPPASPELVQKWNDAVRLEILERISAAKLDAMRRKVEEKARPVAKLAAAAIGRGPRVSVSESDYEFLVLQRNPNDRKIIEDLMHIDTKGMWPGPYSPWKKAADFVATTQMRGRADWLLAIWDRKAKVEMILSDQNGGEALLPRFYLGKVMGRAQFATPINLKRDPPPMGPAAWSGPMLRFHLVPVESGGESPENADRMDQPMWGAPYDDEELLADATFAFTTVRPGKYQLKVIWDKRSPHADEEASPGDYVGTSKVIEVTAGSVITNIVVYCTNRVAGGETYYAADELVNHQWKVTGELARNSLRPDREGRMDIFWRNAAHWIIATNMPAVSNYARLVSMGTTTFGPAPGVTIPRPDRLVMVFRREEGWDRDRQDRFDGPSELRIIDEHGCAYRHMFYTETARTIRYTFFHYPRSAKTWRVVGTAIPLRNRPMDKAMIFDFTVTNLVATAKQSRTPSDLPYEMNVGPVKMRVTDVTGGYLEPTVTAEFFEDGKPTSNWTIKETIAADDHGNFINPLDMCGEQKGVRVIGRLVRNDVYLSIPFEFCVGKPRESQ